MFADGSIGAVLARVRPLRRQVIAVLFSLSSVACASVEHGQPVVSLLEMRQSRVVVQQWDLSCGAAALATVLTYQHGDAVDEREIARGMLRLTDPLRVQVRGGFSLLDLKRYVESRGYSGSGYTSLTLDDLVKLAPVLVPVSFRGYNHFVVFKGVAGERVFLADPGFGNRTVELEQFHTAWLQSIGFVVRRKDGVALPNRLKPRAAELTRPPDAAVRAALK